MFLSGIGTAVPPQRYTKAECLEAMEASAPFRNLSHPSRVLARRVLTANNGIEARHLALGSLAEVFDIDPDTLHRRFVTHAPRLAAEAGRAALDEAGLAPSDCDAVVISTCTGYLCPGLSGYVIERLGLRANTAAYDLVGQGCAAALPNWAVSRALLDSGSARHVLSICVEVCSAAMYLDDDPGVIISTCLFGDGAGAAVLSRDADLRGHTGSCVQWMDYESLTDPSGRDALRFEQRGGLLRNNLTRQVPAMAAGAAEKVLDTVLARSALPRDAIQAWIFHAGGRDVLRRVGNQLQLRSDALDHSAAILRDYGNMSSAFVYFVLKAALQSQAPRGHWWMSSFGAGFSCHGALLRVA